MWGMVAYQMGSDATNKLNCGKQKKSGRRGDEGRAYKEGDLGKVNGIILVVRWPSDMFVKEAS